ncbi:MAG: hypothetical protein IKL52_06365 [Candidatus Gastranaerophilales bacterium]|nr:hypothetical protein [Candidatus Gastranaerophilales bacterium]
MQVTSLNVNNVLISPVNQNKTPSFSFKALGDSFEFNSRKDVAIRYMKAFKNGQKDVLRKINKLNPGQYKMLQEALDVINRSANTNNPFMVFSRKLQCDAGYQDIAQKTFKTKEGARVCLEIMFDENLTPYMSRTEHFENKTVSWLKDSSKLVLIEKMFDEESGTWQLENKFEIINNSNGEPDKIIHSKQNELLCNFIETTEYDLAQYDDSIDVIAAIKNGNITGGRKISSIKFGDNSYEISQNFVQNDTKSKRTYSRIQDEEGSTKRVEYSYQIYDYFDNEIMDIQRTFVINPDGTSLTTIGDKAYTSSFDDFQKTITITDEKSNSINLDVKQYCTLLHQDQLYNFFKTIPADLLIQLYNSDVREIKLVNNPLGSNIAPCANGFGFKMELGNLSEETFAHEIGHIIDYSNFEKLLENQEIKDMYNAEWEIFVENNPQALDKELKYFSQKSPAKGINIKNRPAKDDGGLREMIAEVNMITKTYGLDSLIANRANALVRYFPNTIALIAQNLEASTLI